jgi:hypothetical protein
MNNEISGSDHDETSTLFDLARRVLVSLMRIAARIAGSPWRNIKLQPQGMRRNYL